MTNINNTISANISWGQLRTAAPDVFSCQNLLDAIRFLLNNNTHQRNNETLTEDQEEIFEMVEQLRACPRKMFTYLRKQFAKHFDIDLYVIAFDNDKFSLLTEHNYQKENKAFLSFNQDNTVRGPLYTINENGTKETVFSVHNNDIQIDVYIYVTQINDQKSPSDFCPFQEQEGVVCMAESIEINNISIPTDSSNHDHQTQSRALYQKMFNQIFRLLNNLSIPPDMITQAFEPFLSHIAMYGNLSSSDTIMALKHAYGCLAHLTQIVEPHIVNYPIEQINTPQPTFPIQTNNQDMNRQHAMDSFTSADHSSLEASTSDNASTTNLNVVILYNSPRITKALNSPFHPRNLKEFASKGSSPVQCVDSTEREALHIEVPPNDGSSLFLGMEIVTLDNQNHLSKIIVPNKTKANGEPLINNNDLRCLNCDQCHVDDKLDLDRRQVYSKISSTERLALQKDIRIHIINLYQRGQINKKLVQNKHLKKCKLAIWFCIYQNDNFQRISPVFYSNIIEERTSSTRTTNKVGIKKQKKSSTTRVDVH